jgi:hypothetical protein
VTHVARSVFRLYGDVFRALPRDAAPALARAVA